MSVYKYKDPEARRKYVNKWVKDHYRTIKGFRPAQSFQVLNDTLDFITITPKDFLHDGHPWQPFNVYGSELRVHAPRSLLKRARIVVDKVTGEIKGTNSMPSANK